jgi:DNA-binding CsgD family transcriptional regulator
MTALVGRDEEMARLIQLAGEASKGAGRLVIVSGDGGSGKTSLIAAALALAGGSLRAIHAAASPLAPTPLGPVAGALRALGDGVSERFEAAAAKAAGREALFAAVCDLIGQAARAQPIALVLDDLQWSDHATLELLPSLAETARGTALLVIASYSADAVAAAHPIRVVRDALRRTRKLTEIVLRPLDEAGVVQLAEQCIGSPVDSATARRLLAASGGIPFFVEALAQATLSGNTESSREKIRDAVIGRLDRLSSAGRATAEAAAVLGTEFELELVVRLTGGDCGVEELLGSGLAMEGSNGTATFRPALVRDALYAAIPWTRRRGLHRGAALALESQGLSVHLAAEHWQAAGEALRARTAWLQAAEQARTLHAHRDAAHALNQVLDRWPKGEDEPMRLAALDRLGDASQLSGSAAQALRAWQEVTASAADEPLAAARALRKIANLHEMTCDWSRALAARQDAQAAFRAAGEHAEAAVEGITAAARLRQLGRSAAGLEALVSAAAEAEASGRDDLRVRVAALKANLEVRLGKVSQGIPAIRAALEAALALDQPLLAGEIYQRLADAIERSGNYKVATEVNLEGISFCEQRKAPPGILACLACMSWILIRSGEWDHAAAASQRMADDFAANPVGRAVGIGHVAMVHVLRGELRKAEPMLIEADVMARRMGHALLETTCMWGFALLAAAKGDTARAAERCRAILAKLRSHDERHAAMPAVRWAASCFAEVKDGEGLAACAALLSQSAAMFSSAEPLSALAHAMGEMALLEDDPGRAVRHFDEAIALLEELQLPRERVESELRAACACEASGHTDAAVLHAREAARRAERLGARLLEQDAAARLRRLGQDLSGALGPRAGRRNAQAGLTARQLQILGAISRGLTDKEVARTLGLSPRTVESHVAKALATLECRSRSEAVRKASELGLLARSVARA